MRKLAFSMAAVLLLCMLLTPYHAQASELRLFRLDSPQALMELAQLCKLDSNSENLLVTLTQDIDLTGTDFQGIPIFSGSFDGRGHTISGLRLEEEGSFQGLFRYLTSNALVEDLHIEGIVEAKGSAVAVGSIAGQNAGTVKNCSFSGIVSGAETIGGIAGLNALTGIVENCQVSGSVRGKHFVGGITGQNNGVIRNCRNDAQINTTVSENQIHLEDITLESITGAESAATTTDIGGICGTGSGVIRKCENHGNVGYPKVGFNVGGIAGSFTGFLDRCTNYGTVSARKDTGGIVGHLEPAISMDFETDTVQILQEQMQTMSDLANSTAAQAQAATGKLQHQAESIGQHTDAALDALNSLLEDTESGKLPDPDTVQAAMNVVSGSISAITVILGETVESAQNSANAISHGLDAMSGQMGQIGTTVNNAAENLGGKLEDVSDLDTDADISAKILACQNNAPVSGDWNTGGIVGAVGLENDLDPQSDLVLSGNLSANFNLSFRAVVLKCQNNAPVTGSKQNIGGIAGWASMGLIKSCTARASVDATGADYVGGIAGLSYGFIRSCHARCTVSGSQYAGGIAGTGATVTDCRTIVRISGSERIGAILGFADTLDNIQGNYYLSPHEDPGAIDGISYADCAAPMASEAFFLLEGLPQDFDRVTVTFLMDDGTQKRITLPYGFSLTQARIPELPLRNGSSGVWVGDAGLLDPLLYDTVFTAVYPKSQTVLGSDLLSPEGRPRMLAQGSFTENQQLLLTLTEDPAALYAWQIQLPESESAVTLRLLLPEAVDPGRDILQVCCNGNWKTVAYIQDGSYLVFSCQDNLTQLRIVDVPVDYTVHWIAGGAILFMIAGITAIILACRASKKKAK